MSANRAPRDLVMAALTLLLFAAISMAFPRFATADSLAGLLDDSSILILLALGQMLVILTRGIDLSVAANLALCGMIVALFNRTYPDAGVASVVILALLTGTALGAVNGILVWKLRLPPIVVTLGTMSIFRGVIFLLSHGTWVTDRELSPAFLGWVRHEFLGLTTPCWLAVTGVVAAAIVLRRTSIGRDMYAAGDNPTAASHAGIDPGRMQLIAYAACGALAGLCGYLWVARFAVAYTDIALGFELQVIAACVIGGVAIAGGAGTVAGVVLGCLFLGAIKNALPLIGISPFWQMGINGAVILAAALLSARRSETKRTILESRTP